MRAKSLVRFSALVIALVSPATFAAQVTYNFTGDIVLTSGSFQNLPVDGRAVTGSFTIDLDVLATLQGGENIGDISQSPVWERIFRNGTDTTPSLVTSTITFNDTTYDSLPTSPQLSSARLAGSALTGLFTVAAGVQEPNGQYQSFSTIFKNWGLQTPYVPYLSNGLPNFDAINFDESYGYFEIGRSGAGDGRVAFLYSSLVPASAVPPGGTPVLRGSLPLVPIPAAVWLFASGLGLLGAYRKGRDKA